MEVGRRFPPIGRRYLRRFVPAADFIGVARLSYRASDGRATSKAIENATLTINSVDDRPVLDTKPSPMLTPVAVNEVNPVGDLVSDLLGSAARDVDPTANLGVAVVGAASKNGTWQVMTDGVNWTDLGPVSSKPPRFLHATDHIRFVPVPGFSGLATISYKAWDAGLLDATGSTSMSTAIETATIAVNTAPVVFAG
jgi:hypothetical protein